jgi:hypothetical protein
MALSVTQEEIDIQDAFKVFRLFNSEIDPFSYISQRYYAVQGISHSSDFAAVRSVF